jgi:hypothetical protein
LNVDSARAIVDYDSLVGRSSAANDGCEGGEDAELHDCELGVINK